MTRNEIIEEIYKDRQYIDYCFRVCQGGDIHKDLFQYVVLYLMEMPKGKLEKIHKRGELRMYVARMIYINVNSQRSQFSKQYSTTGIVEFTPSVKYDYIENSEEQPDLKLEKVETKLKEEVLFCHQKNIYPASVKLLEIYSELGSFQKVADATRIPYKTVRRHIMGLTEKIRSSI